MLRLSHSDVLPQQQQQLSSWWHVCLCLRYCIIRKQENTGENNTAVSVTLWTPALTGWNGARSYNLTQKHMKGSNRCCVRPRAPSATAALMGLFTPPSPSLRVLPRLPASTHVKRPKTALYKITKSSKTPDRSGVILNQKCFFFLNSNIRPRPSWTWTWSATHSGSDPLQSRFTLYPIVWNILMQES